jgi:hypothetical protein
MQQRDMTLHLFKFQLKYFNLSLQLHVFQPTSDGANRDDGTRCERSRLTVLSVLPVIIKTKRHALEVQQSNSLRAAFPDWAIASAAEAKQNR